MTFFVTSFPEEFNPWKMYMPGLSSLTLTLRMTWPLVEKIFKRVTISFSVFSWTPVISMVMWSSPSGVSANSDSQSS